MRSALRLNLKRVVDDSYDIIIGTGLVRAARDIARLHPGSRAFVVTDSHVGALYGKTFLETLRGAGSEARLFSVPAGEKSKDRKTKATLEDRLLALRAGRDSVIVALGGGMVGDLAGFVAATLHRGICYVQIPTSLLAQVDSSIGGKVAVDHPLGKNLIGAFCQPERVYIDPSLLKTLPEREFRNGLAEVVKVAVMLDRRLFETLERQAAPILARRRSRLLEVIERSCALKKKIVEMDEREQGLRRILNYGHTIGHAIEAGSRFRIPHGEAVAIGMVAEARIAANLGIFPLPALERLVRLLSRFGLPSALPPRTDLAALFRLTSRDKKVSGGAVHYTLPEEIGKGRTGVRLETAEARALLRGALPERSAR